MKKRILLILGIFIIILLFAVYLLYNYNIFVKQVKNFNTQYEKYYKKTILGTDLATLLNKVADNNEKNNIEKESGKYYIETEKSILVYIKFLEKEDIVKMEDILEKDMQNFVKYYGAANFKCTNIEYHERNNQIKNLYFEQI